MGARSHPSARSASACALALLFAGSACAGAAGEPVPELESHAAAPQFTVSSDAELSAALRALAPGAVVAIAPGEYRGGIFLREIAGTPTAPIRIGGADPAHPPVFRGGGSEGWHLSACAHLTLHDLVVTGFAGNGVNADDGGERERPALGLRFERLTIEEIGPQGNHDALKLSGLRDFVVQDCVMRGWGGSGADLVGCHDGMLAGCVFEGRAGFGAASGVQIKGGSRRVRVAGCVFRDAGARAINAGGSTGADYFRPADADCEARDLLVEHCQIEGSEAAVAAVGVVGLVVRDCEIRLPQKWVLRILQESTAPRFLPCQDGRFERNRITVDERVKVLVNVGPGTLPDSFDFRGNAWADQALPARQVDERALPRFVE